jgi:hypothetical protein
MTLFNPRSGGDLKAEVAAAAARLIAEDGCDYATAKRKAVREVLGDGERARRALPDNAQIEAELRRYLQTFAADTQPALLADRRKLALRLMQQLAAFNPYLVGAVLNGTATEHSDVVLNLYTDSAKEVEMFLLDRGIDFQVGESPGTQETLHFGVAPAGARGRDATIGVTLAVCDSNALRITQRPRADDPSLHPVERSGRANAEMVQRLLADSGPGAGGAAVR